MPTLSYTVSAFGLAGSISKLTTRTADGGNSLEIAVAAGETGSLTTRTDNETGTITMDSASHSVTTAQVVDIYWATGARYEVTVGTVSGASVPIGADNSGSGDNLPAQDTDVIVSPRVAFNAAIDGDNLSLLVIQMFYLASDETAESHVQFLDADDDEIAQFAMSAFTPQIYDIEGGASNIFTGDPITDGFVSNGSATNAGTMKLVYVQDQSP